jgi:predicted flap endonuclease-1-like 5' DNA nuclease
VARPLRPSPAAPADDLRRIRGIDGQVAEHLIAAGIRRYQQIAAWSATDVERFDRQLASAGRIARENWIEQAQILMRGGDTAFSRAFDGKAPGGGAAVGPAGEATARRGTGDLDPTPDLGPAPARSVLLGALRSVRSQAYQNPEPGPEAAHRVGSRNRVVRSPPPQDLKRIRGIGVLIEKRLHAMQITAYEQIANWTREDIERVSRSLDFKGRIERENWVEQARILAAGGATEFSRRVDRGEADTGRYRP